MREGPEEAIDTGKRREIKERDDPGSRAEWFLASRSDEKGEVLRNVFGKAVAHRRRQEREARDRRFGLDGAGGPNGGEGGDGGGPPGGTPGGPGSVNWTPIGPSAVAQWIGQNMAASGRVTGLAVGPSGARVYAGAANGGIWFSSDAGTTWKPLDDYTVSSTVFGGSTEADSLSIGSVGVRFGATAATDDVYVGTGEPTGNYDSYLGVGIRHSSSGGAPGTWSLEATNLTGRGVYGIVFDPDDPAHVLAATTAGLYRRPPAAPFTSWTQVTSAAFTSSSGVASSIVVAGTGASRRFYVAFSGDRAYSSPDGNTWTALTGLGGSGRIALGVCESDPTVVYALREDGTLARLVGTAFQPVNGLPASALFRGGQGWYDMAVLVHPTDPNTIFLGGDQASVFKGTVTPGAGFFTFPFNAANAGNPWADPTFVGQNVHSDVHTLAFGRNAANTASDGTNVWVGSDGGAFNSTSSGNASTFQTKNTGLAITETAYIAQRPDTDAVVFAGTQDNGTNMLLSQQAASEVAGGDGGGVAVDQDNPYRVMRQYVHGILDRSTTGGASGWSSVPFPPVTSMAADQTSAASTESGIAGFVAPIASSPVGVSPGLVSFGTNRLWLSDDWGSTWVTLPAATNPYTSSPPDAAQDVIDGNSVSAIAFASGTRIFAATYTTVWRYDKAATWSRTVLPTTGLPGFHIFTDLAVADAAAGTLYATLGSGGVAHLYYFDGTSWQVAMPTSVVDVPTHAVAVDPSSPTNVYVGTDVGCWKGVKTGPTAWTWSVFSQGLPEAAIVDLEVHDRARLLRASTHGRGVWEIDLSAATGQDPDLYLRVNYADTGRLPGGARHPWVEGAADPTRQGALVYHWMSADVKVRRPSLSGLPALATPPDYLDYAVNIGDYVDSTTNIETADVTGTNRIFVEVHNRGLTPITASQVKVLLLVTDAYGGLPSLPANYAAHITAGDTNPAWLAGTPWHFADPATPFKPLPHDLDVRTPGVVEFPTNFSSLSLPLGHDHVCAAAFVTAPADALSASDPSLDNLTMHDKHVAHRNLHLVAAGAMPSTESGGGSTQSPQTFIVQFHHPGREKAKIDLHFERASFPGTIAVALPPRVTGDGSVQLDGFELVEREAGWRSLLGWIGELVERLGEEIEELGEALEGERDEDDDDRPTAAEKRTAHVLASLDRKRVLVGEGGSTPTIRGIELGPGETIAAAVTIEAPPEARPGDRYRLDIVQRNGGEIVGGSSYEIVVYEQKRRR